MLRPMATDAADSLLLVCKTFFFYILINTKKTYIMVYLTREFLYLFKVHISKRKIDRILINAYYNLIIKN